MATIKIKRKGSGTGKLVITATMKTEYRMNLYSAWLFVTTDV